MRFADRFKFLMRITETCNKDLAAELSVDPSMISLMRTGRRKLPKNPAHIKKIALYFARHSTAEYQRRALSEIMGQASISPSMPAEVLADLLEDWLLGEDDMLGNVLESIRPLPPKEPHEQPDAPEPMPENRTLFFFGDEGRREVMRRVMGELRGMETPCTVLTAVDDNLEWLLSDYLLTKQMQSSMLEVLERGFSFCQIMPPLNFINRYAESLKFWLPLYATGRMEVYYYPRLRGNLYRHSIIVVPGRCVQFSAAISTGSANEITMFSTDLSLVNAFVRQYKEHLALCRQSLVAHRDPKDFLPCFADIFSRPGDIVQTVSPLSTTSMPKELLE